MEQILLTVEEIEGLDFTYDFTPKSSRTVDRHYNQVIAKAQVKKLVEWLKPCILAEIYSPEAGADVICIGQRDWEAILKEIE